MCHESSNSFHLGDLILGSTVGRHGLTLSHVAHTARAQMLEQRRAQGVTAHQRRLWDKMGLKHADEDEEGEEAARAKAGAISYGKARSRAKLEGKQGKTPWSKK